MVQKQSSTGTTAQKQRRYRSAAQVIWDPKVFSIRLAGSLPVTISEGFFNLSYSVYLLIKQEFNAFKPVSLEDICVVAILLEL